MSDPSVMSILLGDAKVGSANWRSLRNIQSSTSGIHLRGRSADTLGTLVAVTCTILLTVFTEEMKKVVTCLLTPAETSYMPEMMVGSRCFFSFELLYYPLFYRREKIQSQLELELSGFFHHMSR